MLVMRCIAGKNPELKILSFFSSAGKESTSSAGDTGSIPGLGRSSGEGRDRETWVQSLGGEDPLEEGMATHSSILALRIP